MSYAGSNRGGTAAILAAEQLVQERNAAADAAVPLAPELVVERFRHAIDRIMGEGGLWDEATAAKAFLQAAGDPAEAVHLIRAYRSTLPRFVETEPLDPESLTVLRRIVPAERDPDGPQLLGETTDYTPRLLGAVLPVAVLPVAVGTVGAGTGGTGEVEDAASGAAIAAASDEDTAAGTGTDAALDDEPALRAERHGERYSDTLRRRGLVGGRPGRSGHEVDGTSPDPAPFDPGTQSPSFPADRSAWLAALALAETGGLVGRWFESLLGPDGYADENVTLGDVRHGRLPIVVAHPATGAPASIGEIRVTDAEAIVDTSHAEAPDAPFALGYGMALGFNERKAIVMAHLDVTATLLGDSPGAVDLHQFVLLASDGLASNGFLEHLKLPHYVTFQSTVERVTARSNA
jgi:alpha-D-ribose 1-methylphosphonate 5-triphosphate synthase subunit PhnI